MSLRSAQHGYYAFHRHPQERTFESLVNKDEVRFMTVDYSNQRTAALNECRCRLCYPT